MIDFFFHWRKIFYGRFSHVASHPRIKCVYVSYSYRKNQKWFYYAVQWTTPITKEIYMSISLIFTTNWPGWEKKKNNKLAQDEQKGKWFWVFNVAMNSLSLPIPLDRFGLVNSKSCAWERFHLPLNWIATRYETILSYIFFFSLSLAICLLLFGIRVYPFSCSAHNFQWAYFLSNGPLLLSFWPFALNIWLLHLLFT